MTTHVEPLGQPPNQFLASDLVMVELAAAGAERAIRRTPSEVVVLSMIAGALITAGALFSTLIATGTENEALQQLLEGLAYFSLANPEGIGPDWPSALAWSIAPAAVGNVLGAFFLVALPFWWVNSQHQQ